MEVVEAGTIYYFVTGRRGYVHHAVCAGISNSFGSANFGMIACGATQLFLQPTSPLSYILL